MGIAPVTLTYADGSTIALSREGNVVTALATPGTLPAAGVAAQPIPAGYDPAGFAAMYQLRSPGDTWGTPGAWYLSIDETETIASLGIFPARMGDGPWEPFTVQWLAEASVPDFSGLDGLLGSLPGFDVLTPQMKQRALDMSLIPDAAGVWPGYPGYVTTYDIYWAAISLSGYMMAQPFVKQAASEGTSATVDRPDWSGILNYFRSQSPIAQATQAGPILNPIPIPDFPHVVRTDMSGRWDGYGDVDTDLG